jgi:hypothetical protein
MTSSIPFKMVGRAALNSTSASSVFGWRLADMLAPINDPNSQARRAAALELEGDGRQARSLRTSPRTVAAPQLWCGLHRTDFSEPS